MCLTCGCGEPHNDHGDPAHITYEKFKEAADAAEGKRTRVIDVDLGTLSRRRPRTWKTP